MMSPSIDAGTGPLGPGDRLPAISLPPASGGRPVQLRAPARGAIALVFLRGFGREPCRAYAERLADAGDRFRVWGGRVLFVPAAGAAPAPRLERAPFGVLADPGGEARRRCRIPPERVAVVIADRWGEVFHVAAADSAESLPAPSEVEGWLKYLATQCAECGVPDEPGYGAWAH